MYNIAQYFSRPASTHRHVESSPVSVDEVSGLLREDELCRRRNEDRLVSRHAASPKDAREGALLAELSLVRAGIDRAEHLGVGDVAAEHDVLVDAVMEATRDHEALAALVVSAAIAMSVLLC